MSDTLKRRVIFSFGLFLSATCFVVAYRKFTSHPVTMATHAAWGTPPLLMSALAVLEAAAGILMPFRRTAFAAATAFSIVILAAIGMHLAHAEFSKLPLPVLFFGFTGGYAFASRGRALR